MDISSMLEVQVNEVKEVDIKENVTPRDLHPSTVNVPPPISQEESNFYKLMFGNDISAVRFRRLHCTACDIHIGSAPADANNMTEHPVLRTLLCESCKEFYGEGTFEQGDDATDMFCRWCANGGNLYCCSFCSNTFCYKCIKRNFDPMLRKKIEADEKWKCFVCDPTDLYTARATCWALLQHVHTLASIIKDDSKLTPEEVNEKMKLDESQCCPRRRKRKRRRTGSNSEEDDKTYIPKYNSPPVISKRKKRGRGRPRSNGVNMPISMRLHDFNEIPPPLLSCEQTMIEDENATVNADGTIASSSNTKQLPPTFNPNVVQSPIYNAAIMSVLPATNYAQSSSSVVPLQHVTAPLNQVKLYQTMQYTQAPMVTIPNQSASLLNRPRVLVPEARTSTMTVTPNIIEIESDSEESATTTSTRNMFLRLALTGSNNATPVPAVPIALVSSKNNYTTLKKQDTPKWKNEKTFNQRLLPHRQEIDYILNNLKTKLHTAFETAKREELQNYDVSKARSTVQRFHHEIRTTVIQLAHLNDRIICEYNKWRRHQPKRNVNNSSVDNNNIVEKTKDVDIPLEMICVNESDTDSDNCDESEYNTITPSDLIGSTNAVEGLRFFKQRSTMDRSTGGSSVLSVNKSVQTRKEKPTSKPSKSNAKPNPSFGNFEEQFILYLKHAESQAVQQEDSKESPDPNETPLKDLIEANSPFISKMLESMDTSIVSNNSNKPNESNEERNLTTSLPESTTLTTSKAVDELVKIVNKVTDDLDTDKQSHINAPIRVLNESLKEKKVQRKSVCTVGDDSMASSTPIPERDSNRSNCNLAENESEEDCTIIDD